MPQVIQTNDFDELREAQIGWDLHYRLISGGAFSSSLWVESGVGMQFDCETWNRSVEIHGLSHSTNCALLFSAHADRSFLINGHYVSGRSLVALPPNIEIHAVTGEVGSLFSFSLDELAMSGLGEDFNEDVNRAQERKQLLLYPDRSLGELRKVSNAMTAGTIPHGRKARHWITARVITRISRIMQSAECAYSPPPKNIYRVAKQSRDYMMCNLTSSVSIPIIAQKIGASERSVHYAFQSVFGTTPKAFLKLQRMSAARNALIKAESNESIRSIMIDFGFVDASHFAKDYRQQFGELPSETIRRCS